MGKILSNEDLKYLSIRSETPRLEGASRKNSSKRKFLFDHQSNNALNRDLLGEDNPHKNLLLKPAKQPLSGCNISKNNFLNISKLSPSNLQGIEDKGVSGGALHFKKSLSN